MRDEVNQVARAFFEGLNRREDTRAVLSALDQTVRFLVEDGEPFCIEVKGGALQFRDGAGGPEVKDHEGFTHLRTNRETVRRLVAGEIRYSDAIIPSSPDMGRLCLVEKWMFKKQVVNWLGRLIRMGQEGVRWPASRPTGGWKGEG
ncbi:MAG: hypothetical protein HYY21_01475 [Candidatus Tectomicrobia bacterium]|nr:hypothetical protein [Candidatus Tectomicrobia bacterium]